MYINFILILLYVDYFLNLVSEESRQHDRLVAPSTDTSYGNMVSIISNNLRIVLDSKS